MGSFLFYLALSLVALLLVAIFTPKKKKLLAHAPPPGEANTRGFADWCMEKITVLSYAEVKNADLVKTAMSLCNFIAENVKTPFLRKENAAEWERVRSDTMELAGFREVEFATYLFQIYADFERFGENTKGEIDFVREHIASAKSRIERFYWNTILYIGFNPTIPEMMMIYTTQSKKIAEEYIN